MLWQALYEDALVAEDTVLLNMADRSAHPLPARLRLRCQYTAAEPAQPQGAPPPQPVPAVAYPIDSKLTVKWELAEGPRLPPPPENAPPA